MKVKEIKVELGLRLGLPKYSSYGTTFAVVAELGEKDSVDKVKAEATEKVNEWLAEEFETWEKLKERMK